MANNCEMRLNKMHPNLFFAVIGFSIWTVLLGVIMMLCGQDKLVNYCFGSYFILAGFVSLLGIYGSPKMWRYSMSITMGVAMIIGIGILFNWWFMCYKVQAIMWIGFAILQYPIIAEPGINPLNVKK